MIGESRCRKNNRRLRINTARLLSIADTENQIKENFQCRVIIYELRTINNWKISLKLKIDDSVSPLIMNGFLIKF